MELPLEVPVPEPLDVPVLLVPVLLGEPPVGLAPVEVPVALPEPQAEALRARSMATKRSRESCITRRQTRLGAEVRRKLRSCVLDGTTILSISANRPGPLRTGRVQFLRSLP